MFPAQIRNSFFAYSGNGFRVVIFAGQQFAIKKIFKMKA